MPLLLFIEDCGILKDEALSRVVGRKDNHKKIKLQEHQWKERKCINLNWEEEGNCINLNLTERIKKREGGK